MCNIWKKKPKNELTTEEIKKAFSSRLFKELRWINLTGGEPFLRKDFVEVIKILNKLPKLEGIAIPTNGFLTDMTVNKVKEALKILDKNKFLSVTVSIDGFEKTHEKIRRIPNAFQKAMKTLEELKKIKAKNFNIGVQPTISKMNIDEIEEFYKFIKTKSNNVGFAVTLVSEGYYENSGINVALDEKDKKRVARFFRKIMMQDPQYAYYYTHLINFFKKGKRDFLCMAGFKTLFMDAKGNIYPCPVLSYLDAYKFGNIRDGKAAKLWFSHNAAKIKKRLKKNPICDKCTMMCDYINVIKVSFFEFTMFHLQHPKITYRLFKKAKQMNGNYF